jgi:Cu+-exporting ATPase
MDQTIQKFDLAITGMSCASCVSRVEKSLRKVPGVGSATVNLATESAHVEGSASEAGLLAAVEKAGYGASLLSTAKPHDDRRELLGLAAAFLLTAPLWVGMVLPLPAWAEFALATPVQFWLGARFYAGAYKALRAGVGNMDLLVALGTSAAYFLSAVDFCTHGPLYFESSATVITLILLGKFLENRAKREAASAMTGLSLLRPAMALMEDGTSQKVETLAVGANIKIRPGERVPVDGTILTGTGSMDESFITGESLPQPRGPGAKVLAGALNLDGALTVSVTAAPGETLLDRMARLIEGAQTSKPAVQKLADQVASVFVPVVLGIALITLLGWLGVHAPWHVAIINAVSVLVIACPCALGLATPAAILAGTGAGAKHGILVRDADILREAARVTLVIFDKTGTLTEGKPQLAGVRVLGDMAEPEIRAIASALAAQDTHPLSAALRFPSPAPVQNFKALPGRGVQGSVAQTSYLLGSAELITEAGGVVPKTDLPADATLSYLAYENGTVLAAFGFTDTIRPGAAAAIARLHRMGLKTMLLSGDRRAAAQAVGTAMGINNVISEASPAEKLDTIRAAQKEGAVVAMVGDGINDAPALAAANAGIAMGSGADVAIETAGISVLRPEPMLVVDALDLAHRTWRILQEGLFWALAYNVVGIPLAAFGVLTPSIAGGAMAASSVCVLANALRLRGWKPSP